MLSEAFEIIAQDEAEHIIKHGSGYDQLSQVSVQHLHFLSHMTTVMHNNLSDYPKNPPSVMWHIVPGKSSLALVSLPDLHQLCSHAYCGG